MRVCRRGGGPTLPRGGSGEEEPEIPRFARDDGGGSSGSGKRLDGGGYLLVVVRDGGLATAPSPPGEGRGDRVPEVAGEEEQRGGDVRDHPGEAPPLGDGGLDEIARGH